MVTFLNISISPNSSLTPPIHYANILSYFLAGRSMLLIRVLRGSVCTWSKESDQDDVVNGQGDTAHVPLPQDSITTAESGVRAKVIRQGKQPDKWALMNERPTGKEQPSEVIPAIWLTVDGSQEPVIKVFAEAISLPHLPPHSTLIALGISETTE